MLLAQTRPAQLRSGAVRSRVGAHVRVRAAAQSRSRADAQRTGTQLRGRAAAQPRSGVGDRSGRTANQLIDGRGRAAGAWRPGRAASAGRPRPSRWKQGGLTGSEPPVGLGWTSGLPAGVEPPAAAGELGAVAVGARGDAVELGERLRADQRRPSGELGAQLRVVALGQLAVRPRGGVIAGVQQRVTHALAAQLGGLPARARQPERDRARRRRAASLGAGRGALHSLGVALERGGPHSLGQHEQSRDVAGEHRRTALARQRTQRRGARHRPARRPLDRERLVQPDRVARSPGDRVRARAGRDAAALGDRVQAVPVRDPRLTQPPDRTRLADRPRDHRIHASCGVLAPQRDQPRQLRLACRDPAPHQRVEAARAARTRSPHCTLSAALASPAAAGAAAARACAPVPATNVARISSV